LLQLHMGLKKAASALGGDPESLLRDYLEVSGTLQGLGLTDYEARAYVALVALGTSRANIVAEISQIPRTSAYKVMLSLEAKGFVRSKPGRPRTFSAVDPDEMGKALMARVDDAFGRIAKVKDILSERGVPQLVFTILGRDRVVEKVGEMLDRSEHSLAMSSPSVSVLARRLRRQLTNALSRGVKVTVITSPFVKAPKGCKVIRRKGLIATDVIADGKTALIAAPDLSACGYTDNEALSRHLENFLDIMAESGD
jgi:sugar-specific transcriptional regulator TrmB